MQDTSELITEAEETLRIYEAIKETRESDPHNHYPLHYDTHAETADLIQRLLDVVKEREWRDIAEHNKDERTYLVFSNTHGYQTDCYTSNNSSIPGYPRFGVPNITHYMELPLPPKPETGGE